MSEEKVLLVLSALGSNKRTNKLKGFVKETGAMVRPDLDGHIIVILKEVNKEEVKNFYSEIKAIFGRKVTKKYYSSEYSMLQVYITC